MSLLACHQSQSWQPSIPGSNNHPIPRVQQALSVNMHMCAIMEQGNAVCVTDEQIALLLHGICCPDIILLHAPFAWQDASSEVARGTIALLRLT